MRVVPVLLIGIPILLSACKTKKDHPTSSAYKAYIDTTISVYGPYAVVKLPITKGVKISNPIHITLGPDDVLYAANQTGEIYSLRDSDEDGIEDSTALYCDVREFGLRSPAGFAHRGDTIYIGTAQQIRAFLDQDSDGKADTSWVFFDNIPESGHPYEWTSALTVGPDGWFYCALATDSWNAAPSPDPNGYRGSILRISPNGKIVESVATGIRSVYGISFNDDGDLFFTDNEGGGNPNEELNLLVRNGFYGHNPAKYKHDTTIDPAYVLETEVAPSGILFNNEKNDFGGAAGNLFVAYYGPGERWNRGAIARIELERLGDGNYGFKEIPIADLAKVSDLEFGKDGSLYVSQHGMADYWYNVVYENQGNFYKLIYDPALAPTAKKRAKPAESLSISSVETGKQLFAESACLACHQVDGVTELLGPNLKDVAKQLSREEILEEIMKPSERIKPSMGAQQITKKDGQVFLGRIISSNQNELQMMLVGNNVVTIPRNEIKETIDVKESLMYEGLLTGMAASDQDALLDYIVSLSQ